MSISNEPIIFCPHCNEPIIIEKINCGIFRHGIIKSSGEQIPPHAKKEECEYFIKNNLIFGCGKPFQITLENDKIVVIICDYI